MGGEGRFDLKGALFSSPRCSRAACDLLQLEYLRSLGFQECLARPVSGKQSAGVTSGKRKRYRQGRGPRLGAARVQLPAMVSQLCQ